MRALTTTFIELMVPLDPFIGQELSGGPACVGCGSSQDNVDHTDGGDCYWYFARKEIVKIKEQNEEIKRWEASHE